MTELSSPSWSELLELVTQLDASDYENIAIEYGGVSIRMSRGDLLPESVQVSGSLITTAAADASAVQQGTPVSTVAPEQQKAAEPVAQVPAETAGGQQGTAVTSPMIGVFYRSPSPGAAPFVKEGDRVEAETTVGIIEVMKLMNPVHAGVAGTVSSFAVEDAQMIEYGQKLLFIIPDQS